MLVMQAMHRHIEDQISSLDDVLALGAAAVKACISSSPLEEGSAQ